MGRKNLIVIGLFLFATLRIEAQSGSSDFEFVENKGQWDSQVKFKGELSSGAFFLQKKGFTVLLHHPEDLAVFMDGHLHHGPEPKKTGVKSNGVTIVDTRNEARKPTIRSHSYRVEFVGANENVEIVPDKVISFYHNYFLGSDSAKWVRNARVFQAIVYKNIYPNIDIRYYSENGQLKYDIIVHPGGDVNRIALKYTGADKISIRNQELVIRTSVGDVRELYPYTFQFDNVKGRKEIDAKYEIGPDNIVKFAISEYSKTSTLVIDPVLVFSSFTGSSANQFGFTATPAPDGSFYSGGIVFGQGFPTTPGAFQTNFAAGTGSGVDIGIMKFGPNGPPALYATYIGGKANDYPHSLYSDPLGNLVVMGRTYSSDYPGTLTGPGGNADICVTKLNSAGTAMIGSMRIGGAGPDGVNIQDQQEQTNHSPISLIRNYGDDSRSEVILDGGSNIFVAAQTSSPDFPKIGAGFDKTIGGGQDGVVIKIDPNVSSVQWTTYLGGSSDDGAFVLALNPTNGNLYVAGATSSSNFPGNTAGSIQPGFQGGSIDGYVTIISNDGASHIKTTYLGTSAIDIVYGIQFDRAGFPYVMGITRGSWQITPNVTFKNPGSGQFVAKLQPDLSAYVYSTTFGTGIAKPNISPVAFLVDRCENVYISGWGGNGGGDGNANRAYDIASLAGMPITPDALKSVTDDRDFYFIVIQKNAAGTSPLYGSFFGQDGGYGEHVDGGTSRYDQQGVIYQAICANCSGGATFPTTPGSPPNRALPSGCNLAAVKISFNYAGVAAGPKSFFKGVSDSVGCVPFNVTFRDTVRNAQSYEWNFGDGSPDVATGTFETAHVFNAVGDYRVRLIAIDSNTCNVRDTAFITIRVRDDIAVLDFTASKLDCEDLEYRFENLSVAPPGKPFKGTSFTWDFGDGTKTPAGPGPVNHTYAAAGTFIVRLLLTDTAYCNAPDADTLSLRISPLVDARFEVPPGACAPFNAVFNNTSLAGQQFFWDFGDGTTSTAVNPTHLYPNVGTFTIRLVAIDSATCNIIDSTQVQLTVSNKPVADFSHAPIPAEENRPTVFTNLSSGGSRYKWFFGDGDSTIKTTMDTVVHQYNATGTYNACLITYNQAGCTDTICKPIDARVIPLLDVPNAFTPGRFGKNSVVYVEGFGIARMTWRIFNRWGQKVFESFDRRSGWDGTFNGQIQPMDVYAYTLDVEFSDGTKVRKSGDITLIR